MSWEPLGRLDMPIAQYTLTRLQVCDMPQDTPRHQRGLYVLSYAQELEYYNKGKVIQQREVVRYVLRRN